ncbi:hypothetical protein XELAEV_18033493mg [Xenopus laevis]|uniref:Uncharacterized protein n=1 Tax=Xenopus laevis TaxID=8355 RepID=A0A974CJF1_XENLA|nr:hypothetical protein XELAEV_18033493mg [Xenopus laevis]
MTKLPACGQSEALSLGAASSNPRVLFCCLSGLSGVSFNPYRLITIHRIPSVTASDVPITLLLPMLHNLTGTNPQPVPFIQNHCFS